MFKNRFVNIAHNMRHNAEDYKHPVLPNKFVGRNKIYSIMRTKCHDGDPNDCWQFLAGIKRKKLLPWQKTERFNMAELALSAQYKKSDEWWLHNVCAIDPIHAIIPKTYAPITLSKTLIDKFRKRIS